jgi:hypothetical protein
MFSVCEYKQTQSDVIQSEPVDSESVKSEPKVIERIGEIAFGPGPAKSISMQAAEGELAM